ncbi:MAG: cell division FtsA domain-containing protein [Christensenellales bacterium]
MRNVTAAIEFGTSKVMCVIGRKRSAGRFEVLGAGEAKYEGIKNGQWQSPSNVEEAVAKAIEFAEKRARKRIKEAFVGVPGAFCKVVCREGCVAVETGRVADTHIEMLIGDAEKDYDDSRYCVINSTPVYFVLGDGNYYIDAEGAAANELTGMVSMVFASNEYIEDVSEVFLRLGVKISAFLPDILAESMFLVPAEERDLSAVLLNIGYYDTNVTVVYGDAIVYNKTIYAGGMHISNDLSIVLNMPLDMAEQIKKRYSFGLESSGAKLYDYAKHKTGKLERFAHSLVSEIIDARVEHLCMLICAALEQSPLDIARRTRIFLSGGGLSMIKGVKETLQKHLKRQVRIPGIEAPQLSTPSCYTALALLDYVFDAGIIISRKSGMAMLERLSTKMFD